MSNRTQNQREKDNAEYDAVAWGPLRSMKDFVKDPNRGLRDAKTAADEQEKRGITQNRVKARNKRIDARGIGRHTNQTLLDQY